MITRPRACSARAITSGSSHWPEHGFGAEDAHEAAKFSITYLDRRKYPHGQTQYCSARQFWAVVQKLWAFIENAVSPSPSTTKGDPDSPMIRFTKILRDATDQHTRIQATLCKRYVVSVVVVVLPWVPVITIGVRSARNRSLNA